MIQAINPTTPTPTPTPTPIVTPTSGPVASFTATPYYGTATLSVQFTDTSTNNPTSWSWTFGDGGSSTDKNPTHVYTTGGNYAVSLTATNAAGSNTKTESNYIIVYAPPPNERITNGGFGNDLSNGWITGGSGPGYYGVNRILSGGYSQSYAQLEVNGYPSSNANVDLYQENVDLTGVSTISYHVRLDDWYRTGSRVLGNLEVYIDNTMYQSLSPPSSYWYTASFTVPEVKRTPNHRIRFSTYELYGGMQQIGIDEISAYANPPIASFTATPTSGTVPFIATFTDTSTNSPTSWAWDFGDGYSSNTQNPTHTYSTAGTFTVSLMAANSAGSNTDTKSGYISASSPPTPTPTPTPVPVPVAGFTASPTSGTVPITIQFTDTSTNTPTAWSWTFGDGQISTTQNPAHTYTSAWNFTVSLTATNAGGSNTITRINLITVTPPRPLANFTATPINGNAPLIVQFTDTSTNTPTVWNWSFGDGTLSAEQNPVHTYALAGNFPVSLTATNAGGSNTTVQSDYITVLSPPGIVSISSRYLDQPGEETTLALSLDNAPKGLSGYNVNVSVSNATVAQITSVSFPPWASTMNSVNALTATRDVMIKASDVNSMVGMGAADVPLANVTVKGLSQGITAIILSRTNFDDENGTDIPHIVMNGTLTVGSP